MSRHRPLLRPGSGPARVSPGRDRDAGFTLVEIVMAIVLSSIIGGVMVAALATSMNAAEATTSSVANSVDEQLISAFLTKDAQAAGGVDPLTADVLGGLGVSTIGDASGWAGCTQSAQLVVRFAWIDRSADDATEVAVTYALHADGSFVRRACQDGTSSEAVLGRSVVTADVRCEPDVACAGLPEAVTLTVSGGDAPAPFEFTMRASLRPEMQLAPSLANSAQVPVVLSGASGCPALDVGTGAGVFVLGDLVVDGSCGATPITGDLSELDVAGSTLLLGTVTDPLSTLAPPATPASCASAVVGTPMLGSSLGPDSTTIHSSPITISGPITFLAGRHVFCGGLALTSGAELRGTGVLLYVADGGVDVGPGATLSITPADTGVYAGISLWSAGTDDVAISSGATVHEIGGTVYAPDALVELTSTSGIRIGSLVADRSTIRGSGPTRFGSPRPVLSVASTQLPSTITGRSYATTAPRVTGGTAPYEYRSAGLPAGLTLSPDGDITGTPTATGTSIVSFVVTDATGASVAFTRTLDISGGVPPTPQNLVASAGAQSAAVSWTPGVLLGSSPTTGYVVTATPTRGAFATVTCSVAPPIATCTLALTDGVTYTIAVTATNANGASAPALTTVTPRPSILADRSNVLWLDATDPDADGRSEGLDEQCNPTATCASTGSVLTRWEDKSGAGNDAVQNTASMAGRYVTSLPAVNFDANGFYTAPVPAGRDLAVFAVVQSDTPQWNNYGWLLASRRPNGVIIHPWPGGTDVGWFPTNSGGAYFSPVTATVPSIMSPHIYDISQSGSNPISMTVGLDGRLLADGVLLSGQTRTSTSIEVRLGADDFGTRYGDGKYREVIVFRATLDAQQRRSVHEYLARRWSIAITPSAPTNVVASPGAGSVTVTWTAPTFDGGAAITGSRVTAQPGGASCTTSTPSSSSCTVTGLTDGVLYTFVVNAINATGTGPTSAASNRVTPGPPPPPTSPTATTGSRQATVSWTAPVLDGHAPLTGYTVTATASGQTTQTCTATPPTTTCTVTGLTNDVTYTFAVVATNAPGNSPSATTTGTPIWTPAALGSALTWWFDASVASDLTGSWVTQSGFTVSGTAGSTRVRASAGVVERVDVVNGGSGYTSSPTLTISGGGGSGAFAADLTVTSGAVSLPNLYVRGGGYTSEPSVTSSGGGGTGARFRARITAPVAVGATIRIAGQTYTVTDRDGLTLTISPALAADAAATPIEEWQVSAWRNRAPGATLDARQTSASRQPALGTMAGRTAVVFTGIDQLMSLLDGTGGTFDKGANWTAVVAYQAERQLAWGALGQPWNAINTRVFTSTGGGIADWQSGQNIEVIPSTGTDSVTGGPVRIGVDSGDGTDTHHWNIASIGSLSQPSYTDGWSFSGAVGEIIFVNAGLDSTAVADATAYLTAKWAQSNAVPSAPINVTATPGDAQTTVAWRASNPYLSSVDGYTVTATAAGQTTRTCTTTGSLNCTLTGLTNGALYTVTVTATSAAGTGPASVPTTVVSRPALLTSSNSRLWLDAADIDGDGWIEGAAFETAVTSGAVQTWNDKSGRSNRTSAPSAALRPTATSQTMNGLPTITFNGTTVLQGVSAANPYGITGDRTMFVVTRRRSGTPHRIIDRTPEDNPLFGIDGSNRLEVRDDANGQYTFHGASGSTPNTTTVLTTNRSGTSLGIWSNATLSGTGTISGSQTMRAISVGRHFNVTSTADFDVAEVVLFDRALTAAERRTVEEYLRIKWGATLAPDAPTSVAATQSNRSVTVSWTAPADGGSPITGYTVTASPGGATCTTTTTSCAMSNLTPGVSYTFTVTATSAVGTGPASAASASVTRNQIVDGTTLVAYGLRRLTNAYSGPLVQVRRTSDSVTANIGFTATGDLDTTQLTAFVGNGSATVSLWYDQSGNGRHASLSTASTEPRLVNAGVVHTVNGRPMISFNGASDALQATVPGPGTQNLVASFVAVSTVPGPTNSWGRPLTLGRPGLNAWTTPGNVTFTRYAGTNRFGVENSDAGYGFDSSTNSIVSNGVAFGYAAEFAATRHRGALNGTPTADFTPLTAADTWDFTHLRIGQDMQMNSDTWLNGSVGEMVVGTTSFTTYRSVVEASMQAYFGIG